MVGIPWTASTAEPMSRAAESAASCADTKLSSWMPPPCGRIASGVIVDATSMSGERPSAISSADAASVDTAVS
ncbi:hypothetical protein D3C86_1886340 [compost metagenome]